MSGKTGLSLKYVRFLVILLLAGMVVPALGAPRERDNDRPGRAEDPRREQMRQEAQTSASEIAQMLTQILGQVNQNQKPQADFIEQAAAKLEENKRFLPVYDDAQKARYMLLQAWTDFYQGRPDDAMNWSLRACKMDESSRDAWNSQAVFCMLNGKRPLEPRIEKSKPRPQRDNDMARRPRPVRANAPADFGDYAVEAEPYSRQGTLNFELTALRREMLDERFGRIEYQDAGGKKIEYVPGENTLCIFFWQVEPTVVDANDVAGVRAKNNAEAVVRGLNSSPGPSFMDQRRYIGNLVEGIQGHPEITCFALNTNSTSDVKRAAAEADEDFALEMGAPLVFAAADMSGAEAYAGLEAQEPFMLIADKEGIVRYAGPAADFMPAFILTHLSGAAIPLNSPGRSQATGQMRPSPAGGLRRNEPGDDVRIFGRPVLSDPEEPMKAPNAPAAEPNAPTKAPNAPVAEPNAPDSKPKAVQPPVAKPAAEPEPAAKPKPAPEETVQYRQLPLEEDIQAQKELSGADTFIKLARKRGLTYKRGVEMCRAIIKKYPGTQYEHDARELLKEVPEHKRGTYNITDEELGL